MQNDNPSWIVLAHLLRPQGRRGELLAELLTDFPDRFKERPQVFLAEPDFKGKPDEARGVEVTSAWLPLGKNKGRIVLHFAAIDSISAAEAVAGMDVVIPFAERLPLDEESVYTSDLVGCTIYDNGAVIGVVEDVQFPTTPDGNSRLDDAAPILEVKSVEGDEVLIPFARAMIQEIDVAQKRIDMTLPHGLISINRTPKSR
jgi:16S rRNA processing protein RimM